MRYNRRKLRPNETPFSNHLGPSNRPPKPPRRRRDLGRGLVITRRLEQNFYIGKKICITLIDVHDGSVRVHIVAPPELTILRGELLELEQTPPAAHAAVA